MTTKTCRFYFLLLIFFFAKSTVAQNVTQETDKVIKTDQIWSKDRVKWVAGGHVAVYGGSLTGLSVMWYSKSPRTGFHFFDDNDEWLQVDKVGHMYSAYQMSRASYALWKWAGLSEKKSIWIGGVSGLAFQTIIEILDGFQEVYGFSVGDYVANILGTGMFVGQQLGWGEQKIKMKFSSYPKKYTEPDLAQKAGSLYGSTLAEKVLKDYNYQTYWLSADIHSLLRIEGWPEWLNLAVGYGADGMFGGRSNITLDDNAGIIFDRSDIQRVRQWYLSPDVNFSKIKTSRKGIRVLLFVLDAVKIPAPALELTNGKLKGHWIMF